jgi:glycerol-3-phosphate dehydrogenase (NAD(P)+)
MVSSLPRISILGAGSWGLTLAWLLASRADAHPAITLWTRDEAKAESLRQHRQVSFPVDVTLPASVSITSQLPEALSQADIIVLVVTSQGTRAVLEAMQATGCVAPSTYLVNASKGIEFPSLKPMSAIIADGFPLNPQAVLSGPTLAKEILRGLPTACSIAAPQAAVAEALQQALSCSKLFRLYSNTDMIGVELGGALKNVIAIASGFMQAKQLGDNARAALMTRGLAEMARFCMGFGAQADTMYGLSGLGDLLATCNSPLSRNFQVGYRLGQGEGLEAILADMRVVAEGVPTARAVSQLAKQRGLDCPVVELVTHALEGITVSEEMMIKSLMARRLKSEVASSLPPF